MNILHISSSYKTDGGAEFCLIDLLKAEIAYGDNPIVIVPRKGALSDYLTEMEIKSIALPLQSWRHNPKQNKLHASIAFSIKRLINFLVEIAVFALIKIYNIDLVHINTTAVYLGSRAAHVAKIPLVWHIREFNSPKISWDFYDPELARSMIQKADSIIAVSDTVAKAYSSFSRGDNLVVIYDTVQGPNIQRNKPLFHHEPIQICLIGNRMVDKGQLDLIEAIGQMPAEYVDKLKVKMYGNDINSDYRVALDEAIAKYGLENVFQLLPFSNSPYEILLQSDIAINCSRSESFGRTTVEGMLAECIVIGNDNTCTHELLKGGNGLLYSDTRDLADQIIWCITHQDEAQSIAHQGLSFATSNFRNGNGSLLQEFHRLSCTSLE